MKFSICRLSEEYIDAVCAMEREIFSAPYSKNTVTADMKNPLNDTWLLIDGCGGVAAYCMFSTVLDEASLDRIAVRGDLRRCGAAQMLIDNMVSVCKGKGVVTVYLEVRQSNAAAIGLYEKNGFNRVGVRKRYYADNGEDAVLYTLILKD